MLVVALPPELTFDRDKAILKPEGKAFVEREIPKLMEVVCSEDFRKNVESVTVEGYSDKHSSPTAASAGTERNLKLGQARAMAVARGSLAALQTNTAQQTCLLEKLSVSGRTEQDWAGGSDVARRVALKVRVRSVAGIRELERNGLHATTPPATIESLVIPPEVHKILNVMDDLRATPPRPVDFRLTQEEINGYLVYTLEKTPRPGLESAFVKFYPYNYVSSFLVIDFDAVERSRPGTIPVLLRPLLKGKKQVLFDIRFKVQDGSATFEIEKAYYGSVHFPNAFAETLLGTVASLQAEQFDLSRPVPLPFGLKQVSTDTGVLAGKN